VKSNIFTYIRSLIAELFIAPHSPYERFFSRNTVRLKGLIVLMTNLLSQAWTRLRTNMRDPLLRKNVAFYMGGKLMGLALVLVAMWVFLPTAVHAATGATVDMPTINAINTAWTLIAAFLVFGMQVGFVMLEAGFARSRESVNILVEGITDTCICGILFWAWGFAFMFEPGTPIIGTQGFFLLGLPSTYLTTGVPLLAFWVFQFAFADTASTITSGAMVGRCGFWGDIIYSIGVTGFIYPIVGHWSWGPDGWLAVLGFHDFAGSTVVHTIGGVISLAGALALGPRLGRVFKRDGGGPPPAHDLIIGAVGGLILWFGWYGFNPGSTLSALDAVGIGRVSFNTTLAACSAGLTALFISYARTKKWDLGLAVNGFLGGLVAITCPATGSIHLAPSSSASWQRSSSSLVWICSSTCALTIQSEPFLSTCLQVSGARFHSACSQRGHLVYRRRPVQIRAASSQVSSTVAVWNSLGSRRWAQLQPWSPPWSSHF
jgi:ammonium transporter